MKLTKYKQKENYKLKGKYEGRQRKLDVTEARVKHASLKTDFGPPR